MFRLEHIGAPGFSVVEHLPLGRDPRVLRLSPTSGSMWGACFFLCLCFASLCVFLMNKEIKSLKRNKIKSLKKKIEHAVLSKKVSITFNFTPTYNRYFSS